ncbi:MAG: hypothetical protein ACOYK9_05205 [Chlamydiia bacterium]
MSACSSSSSSSSYFIPEKGLEQRPVRGSGDKMTPMAIRALSNNLHGKISKNPRLKKEVKLLSKKERVVLEDAFFAHLFLKDVKSAIKVLSENVSSKKIKELLPLGIHFLVKNGELKGAERLLEEFIKISPESFTEPFFINIAVGYHKQKDSDGVKRIAVKVDGNPILKKALHNMEDVESIEDLESVEDVESIEDLESVEDVESMIAEASAEIDTIHRQDRRKKNRRIEEFFEESQKIPPQ